MRKLFVFPILPTLLTLLLVGCNSEKAPAEAAFAQLQSSIAPVSADLEKYAPDEYAQLSAQIDAMKSKLNSKDYAGALALKGPLMAQLVAVSGAAGQRKNQMAHAMSGEWRRLTTAVPAALSQLGSRLALGVGKLPGISAAALQQAKLTTAELNAEWSAALDAMGHRDTQTAVTKAQAVEKRAGEVMAALGGKLGG